MIVNRWTYGDHYTMIDIHIFIKCSRQLLEQLITGYGVTARQSMRIQEPPYCRSNMLHVICPHDIVRGSYNKQYMDNSISLYCRDTDAQLSGLK